MPTIGGVVVATGGNASNRRTLREVVDELARPINASDETVRALAGDSFRAAVRRLNQKGAWPWEVQEQEITWTSGTHTYTVSGNVKLPLAMHIMTATAGVREEHILYVPYERFVEMCNMNIPSMSRPTHYTISNFFENGNVRFWPTPSSSRVCKFTYYRNTPAPRNEDAALEIPESVTENYMAFAWEEFIKRLPSEQRPMPLRAAMEARRDAFREMSSFAARSGDRYREVNIGGML